MFVAGMETDLEEMKRVGKVAFGAASGGVVLPFALGIAAGQGYLLGRPADAPTADAIDLDALSRGGGDWLVERLRAVPA